MNRRHKHDRPEFKREAVALVAEPGESCAPVERRVGVRDELIRRWKCELESQAVEAVLRQRSAHGRAAVYR